MCEPSHSIVQYPTYDPITEDPIKDTIRLAVSTAIKNEIADAKSDAEVEVIKSSLLIPQGAVIGNFINYSRMGFGHSEAIGKLSPSIRSRIPEDVKYESHWHNRSVKLDSWRTPDWVKIFGAENSLESATEYAQRSSIGNLKILRRFLENSLKYTDRPNNYVHPYLQMLSNVGRDKLSRALKRVYDGKSFALGMTLDSLLLDKKMKDRIIGMMLKITRNRENLCVEWSDDDALWGVTPGIEVYHGLTCS